MSEHFSHHFYAGAAKSHRGRNSTRRMTRPRSGLFCARFTGVSVAL